MVGKGSILFMSSTTLIKWSIMSSFFDATPPQRFFDYQIQSKTHAKPKSKPTQIKDVTFDPPNGQVMVNFFLKLSGYHVESQLSRLKHSEMVLGPFENLANSEPDPLISCGKGVMIRPVTGHVTASEPHDIADARSSTPPKQDSEHKLIRC